MEANKGLFGWLMVADFFWVIYRRALLGDLKKFHLLRMYSSLGTKQARSVFADQTVRSDSSLKTLRPAKKTIDF